MDYTKLSKTISYILRHHPEQYDLSLDEQGFIEITLLLKSLNSKKEFDKKITLDDINYILNNSDKKRWEIVDNKIRAYYGHSFEQEIKHQEQIPPKYLYHGTTHEVINKILNEGLLPMERQFVHLSEDIDTATIVGKRRDNNPVILIINSEQACNDGIKFYVENNKIWLCKKIPSEYIDVYKQ